MKNENQRTDAQRKRERNVQYAVDRRKRCRSGTVIGLLSWLPDRYQEAINAEWIACPIQMRRDLEGRAAATTTIGDRGS